MALKRGRGGSRRGRRGGPSERLRPLAPLEAQLRARGRDGGAGQPDGVLRADTESVRLTEDFVDTDDDGPWWRPGPVLLTVLALSLAFVAWIAWLVGTRSVFHPGEGWRYEMEGRPTSRPSGAIEGEAGP